MTFGSPWLEVVLRAGAARDAAERTYTESALLSIQESARNVWSAALEAQTRHQNAGGDEAVARILASVHAQLDSIVVEMEAMNAGGRTSEPPLLRAQELRDQADKIRALREAMAEVERADRML